MKSFFKSSYLAIILLFLYVPILIMMIFSFTSGNSITVFSGWSFKWYKEMWGYSDFIESIFVSIFVGIISTILSLLIGVSACLGLSRMRKIKRNRWLTIVNIPLINADIITAVSLLISFSFMGFKLGIISLIAAHISFNVPYVIITVLPFMIKMDKQYVAASSDLGAGPIRTFSKIILPNLYPSIISACVISFSMSFDDFIISYFTSGSVINVSTFIYSAQRIQPYFNSFGTLLVLIVGLIILFYNIYTHIKNRKNYLIESLKNEKYKAKKLNMYHKSLLEQYEIINNDTRNKKTYNLLIYIKYWYYKILFSHFAKKRIDTKILRLEEKREKILEDIKWEKKVYTTHGKLIEQIKNCKNKLSGEKNKSKVDKILLQIKKYEKKIQKYDDFIEWIEKRNQDIVNEINELKNELIEIQNEYVINKKEKTKKKIKQISKKIAYLEVGPYAYKLVLNLDKQNEIRKINQLQIENLYKKLELTRKQLIKKEFIAIKYENQMSKINVSDEKMIYKINNEKNEFILNYKNKCKKKIIKTEKFIDKIENKILYLKWLYFSNNNIFQASDDKKVIERKNKNYNYSNNRFKRIFKICSLCFVLIFSSGIFTYFYITQESYDLVFANWGSYIDPSIIKDFGEKYKVKIKYQEYDSNETLYNKQKYYDYDIMCPSDYMIQRLAIEGDIQKIDWNNVDTRFDSRDGKNNFESEVKNLQSNSKIENYDITDYSLPYWWGSVGIVFNYANQNVKDFMNEEGLNVSNEGQVENPDQLSWQILWDAAKNGNLKINLNNDPKNLFMYALEKNIKSVQAKTSNDLKRAESDLEDLLHSNKKIGLYDDQLIEMAQSNNFDISVMYNGDVLYASKYGTHDFVVGYPNKNSEGTNVWSDNLVIGKNNKNLNLTYKFINYIYETENQLKNVKAVSMTSTIKQVNDFFLDNNLDARQNELYKFYDNIKNKEAFQYDANLDDELINLYSKLINNL